MVVRMIKWRPWVPLQTKKFEVKITVHSIKELQVIDDDDKFRGADFDGSSKLKVEIKWKGSKNNGFRPLKKKTVKNDFSKEVELSQSDDVLVDDEFKRVCEFCAPKDDMMGDFHPWEVVFLVLYKSKKRTNKMAPLTAPAVLNLSDFASLEDIKEAAINIPLSILHSDFKCSPSLCISLSLMEMKATQELSVAVPKPTMFAPLSPCFGASPLIQKDEVSGVKSSLRKAKSLTDFVSSRKMKRAYQGEGSSDSKFSTGSESSECNSPFDTDSFDDTDEGEPQEIKEDADVQSFCNYGTLVHANLAGGAHDPRMSCEDDMVYYSRHKPHAESSPPPDFSPSVSEQLLTQSPKLGFSWSKGKLSFKSRRVKGEPLLKKDYGEEGGDDIDFYRRQLSFGKSLTQFEGSVGSGSFISKFGDDYFAVGSWEQKEVLSRDGSMRLLTQIFFASIDQRSERAAGESACTALVAVVADWLHSNPGEMPIKSEIDSLIREGSLQWRNLCENENYREKFPDKHFDLETIIQAQICPLSVIPERSFVGFFHPDGMDEECFGFLQGAMSFDNIWDEISRVASELNCNSEPLVYVVSWNDHFFILKIDWDAYYIIDTLGERLYEGCNQAYVLKFNRDTIIEKLPCQNPSKDEKSTQKSSVTAEASSSKEQQDASVDDQALEEVKVICRGKESCKEYIKSFLAAIPIGELQIDMKKGLMSSTPLHQRLQIEFNYTTKLQFFPAPVKHIVSETAGVMPALMAADVQAPMKVIDVKHIVSETAGVMPALMAADVQAPMKVIDVRAPIMVADLQAPMAVVDVPAPIMVADLQAPVAADVPAPVMVADLQAPVAADVPAPMMTVAVA